MWALCDSGQSEWAITDGHKQMSAWGSCWRGHKSELSLSGPYVTPSERAVPHRLLVFMRDNDTHSTQAQVLVFSIRLVFSFSGKSLKYEDIFRNLKQQTSRSLCAEHSPFILHQSLWPCSFSSAFFHTLSNQGLDIYWLLKIVPPLLFLPLSFLQSDERLTREAIKNKPDYCLPSVPCAPSVPCGGVLRAATFDSSFCSQEVNRYLCSFMRWAPASLGASTGSLSGLEGTLQARKRIRQRRRRRMATNVLQAMATNAAVDRPVMFPSGSIKNSIWCRLMTVIDYYLASLSSKASARKRNKIPHNNPQPCLTALLSWGKRCCDLKDECPSARCMLCKAEYSDETVCLYHTDECLLLKALFFFSALFCTDESHCTFRWCWFHFSQHKQTPAYDSSQELAASVRGGQREQLGTQEKHKLRNNSRSYYLLFWGIVPLCGQSKVVVSGYF